MIKRDRKGKFLKGKWGSRYLTKAKVCKTCGEKLYRKNYPKTSYEQWRKRKYCSSGCMGKAQSTGNKITKSKTGKHKECKVCGKNFWTTPAREKDGRGKCCSKKCYTKIQKGKIRKPELRKFCTNCGKVFVADGWGIRRGYGKFCSRKCVAQYWLKTGAFLGENSNNWLGGKSFEPYPSEFNRKLKNRVRKRDNYVCQECGYTQEQLRYNLPVHHIDYDKKNNSLNNLISLCRSCHAQTNFSREDWINYFQGKVL
tara:strand:- start:4960 stop:5724 length:765 start_codon:yes stop_codon:yes gene_type:complete